MAGSPKPPCSVPGCTRPMSCKQLCGTHYERIRTTGKLGPPGDARRRPKKPCAVDGCDRTAKSRGWCEKHYSRWRKHGDPLTSERPSYGTFQTLTYNGYVREYNPAHPLAMADGQVLQHRRVAWDAGILTDPEMHVHHINGNKTDNRPENLEAMTESEHHKEHIREWGHVSNQFGTFPLRKDKTAPRPPMTTAPCKACGGNDFYITPNGRYRQCRDCNRRRELARKAKAAAE